MKRHLHGYGFSFVLHLSFMLLLVSMQTSLNKKAPLVIDFSLFEHKVFEKPAAVSKTPQKKETVVSELPAPSVKPIIKAPIQQPKPVLETPKAPQVIAKKDLKKAIVQQPVEQEKIIEPETLQEPFVEPVVEQAEADPIPSEEKPVEQPIQTVVPLDEHIAAETEPTGERQIVAQELPSQETHSQIANFPSPAAGAQAREKKQVHYLKEHFAYIRDGVQQKTVYPRMARRMGWQGIVKVKFIILQDGRIEELQVLESCGYKVLDENALTAVKACAPFPKPPAKAEVIIPIVYQLT